MRLVTYQSKEAVKRLLKEGYLIMEKDKRDFTHIHRFDDHDYSAHSFTYAYNYIIDRMNKLLPPKEDPNCYYPLWAWYRVNGRRKPTKFLDNMHKGNVRIIFEIDDNKVLLSDFDMFSYILSGGLYFKKNPESFEEEMDIFLPNDSDYFDNLDQMLEINHKEDGPYYMSNRHNTIQATFWKLNLKDVVEIKEI